MSKKIEPSDLLGNDPSGNGTHSPLPEADSARPPDPFDPARLRLSQAFTALVGVKRRYTVIQVGRADKQQFIRVHPNPDYCLQTAILEFKEQGEVYLVDPPLWGSLVGELIPKILYLTVNRQGIPRLWPIRLPDEEGKLDDWNQSALAAAEIAKKTWIRVSANRTAGLYETYEAAGELPEPEWPDLSFREILGIAFQGKFIETWDHPALRRLRGEN